MAPCPNLTRSQAGWAPVVAAVVLIVTWLVLTRIAWMNFNSMDDPAEGIYGFEKDSRQDSITDWRRRQHGVITQSEAWDMYKVGCYTFMATGEIELLTNYKTLRLLECKQRLPRALVIGVKGCDSLVLTKVLGLHPDIISHSDSYFDWTKTSLDSDVAAWRRSQPYSSRFQQTVEHSPVYAEDNENLEGVISQVVPDVKLVVIVRDPVVRVITEFLKDNKNIQNITLPGHPVQSSVFQHPNSTEAYDANIQYGGLEPSSPVEDSLIDRYNRVITHSPLVRAGVYVNTLRKLHDLAPNDSIIVIDRDDFVRHPLQTLQNLETFLGLRKFFRDEHFQFYDDEGRYCVNVERRPDIHCVYEDALRHLAVVDEEIVDALTQYYDQHDAELSNLLQRNFSWME